MNLKKLCQIKDAESKLTDFGRRVIAETITDIGQITPEQKKELNWLVSKGVLVKGQGGPYPKLKTVYAIKGFDFKADREAAIKEQLKYNDRDQEHQRKLTGGK